MMVEDQWNARLPAETAVRETNALRFDELRRRRDCRVSGHVAILSVWNGGLCILLFSPEPVRL